MAQECKKEGHDDLNFSLICLSESCKKKGIILCQKCVNEHDHSAKEIIRL